MYPNLKLELWKMGMRQNRLARILGIDETALSRILNGFRTPDCEMRARIASLLQRDEEWLFEDPEHDAPLPYSNPLQKPTPG